MRGRKPTPREVKERHGNPGKRPLPDPVAIGQALDTIVTPQGELVSPLDILPVPADLPPDGAVFWEVVVPALHESGVLHTVDQFSLTPMAMQWAIHEKTRRALLEVPMVDLGSTGQTVTSPLLKIMNDANDRLRQWFEQYGLTAAARARIGLTIRQADALDAELDRSLGAPPPPPVLEG